MYKIVLASSNKGKSAEIQLLLKEFPIELISQSKFAVDEVEETGSTFMENAIIKARHVAAATGLPALADDSGLVVPSLQGAPGVLSARYAGHNATDTDRIAKLLAEMQHSIEDERKASFHSVIVFMRYALDPAPLCCHGIWHGTILHRPQGNCGFGYDPVFFVPTHHCSAAELAPHEKNRISHRGQALAEFKTKWLGSVYNSTMPGTNP